MSNASTGAARGPYAKTAAVRQRIVDACLEVFTESGYRATTMKTVAERAGISQRGLVHHFKDKEELLAAALRYRDEIEEAETGTWLGSPRALLTAVRSHLANIRRHSLLELHTVLSAEAVFPDHPAHEFYADRYSGFRFYLASSFDALREEGRLTSAARSETLAAMVIALMDGLQVQLLYTPDAVDVEEAFALFFESIGLDFDALDNDPPVAAADPAVTPSA